MARRAAASPALPAPARGSRRTSCSCTGRLGAGERRARQHDHPADRPGLLSRPRRDSGVRAAGRTRGSSSSCGSRRAGRTARTRPSIATAGSATGRPPPRSARTWPTAPWARCSSRSIDQDRGRFRTRSWPRRRIPGRHVPAHDRDAEPDREPGREREAARLGDEYLRLYRDRLGAVTALQARAAAARLYRRGALTIVVGGRRGQAVRPAPAHRSHSDGRCRRQASHARRSRPRRRGLWRSMSRNSRPQTTSLFDVVIQADPWGTVSEIRRPPDSLCTPEASSLGRWRVPATDHPRARARHRSGPAGRSGDDPAGPEGRDHLTYAGGRVKGTSAAPQPDGSVKRL